MQRVQTILLHTKDRCHLEPRAWASTFGSAPFLIYSHLVCLHLISIASGAPCDVTSRQCLSAHSAAHTAAVPPCRCRPQLCQTLLHLTHLIAWPGAPLAFSLALVLGLGLAAVLIPATDCEPTSCSRVEHGPPRASSAVQLWCSACFCFCSGQKDCLHAYRAGLSVCLPRYPGYALKLRLRLCGHPPSSVE